jgi:hypothetical protein
MPARALVLTPAMTCITTSVRRGQNRDHGRICPRIEAFEGER